MLKNIKSEPQQQLTGSYKKCKRPKQTKLLLLKTESGVNSTERVDSSSCGVFMVSANLLSPPLKCDFPLINPLLEVVNLKVVPP